MTRPEKLAELGRWVLRESMENSSCDLEAIAIVEKAKDLGLVTEEPYDETKHGEIYDSEPGDLVYVELE